MCVCVCVCSLFRTAEGLCLARQAGWLRKGHDDPYPPPLSMSETHQEMEGSRNIHRERERQAERQTEREKERERMAGSILSVPRIEMVSLAQSDSQTDIQTKNVHLHIPDVPRKGCRFWKVIEHSISDLVAFSIYTLSIYTLMHACRVHGKAQIKIQVQSKTTWLQGVYVCMFFYIQNSIRELLIATNLTGCGCVYASVCVSVYMHVCVCVYIYACVCVYACVCLLYSVTTASDP